jgi:thiaminase
MGTTTAQLVAALGDRWRAAVDHPFIAACCSGSIQQQHLNTWLTQVCVCVY